MNDLMLIRSIQKGNLPALTFFILSLPAFYRPQTTSCVGFGLLLLNFGINKGYQRENRS